MNIRKVVIKDVCNFVGGSQPPKSVFKSECTDGYIRFIQTRDYKTDAFLTYIPIKTAKRFCKKNDIMIGRYGPPIFQILRGIEGAYNVALMKAVPKPNILNEYLYYLLKQKSIFDYVEMLSLRTGGQTGVDLDSLNQYPVQLPELPYQQNVVDVLKTLDDKIEINNQINSELESIAKTLYDYWFVQFDFPNSEGKPYKSSGGKMVWNEELKRYIPNEWKNGVFGDYSKLKGGFAFNSIWWQDVGIPVIKIKDINEDYTLSLKNCSHVAEDKYQIAKNYEVFQGDVVIALTGATVGKYGIVTKSSKPILVNQRVGFFKLGGKPLETLPFLINSLNQDYFRKTVFILASGAAQPNISTDQIDEIPLVIPQKQILNKYNVICKPFYEIIINNQTENQQLSELRDWLLPMLMNGQVKVK
jgi:type I restriction enzyme S subunit